MTFLFLMFTNGKKNCFLAFYNILYFFYIFQFLGGKTKFRTAIDNNDMNHDAMPCHIAFRGRLQWQPQLLLYVVSQISTWNQSHGAVTILR